MKTNFTKRWLGALRQAVMACVMISAIGISDAAAQTCTVKSNTALDADCKATILASSLATGGAATITFHSVFLDGSTNLVTAGDPSVTVSAPGTYTYQIIDAAGCWGTFVVEDKSGPVCTVGIPTSPLDTLGTRIIECINSANWKDSLDILTASNFKDCSDAITRVYFVDESVEGCDIINPDTLGMPNDGTFTVPATAEICGVYKRTWYAVDGDGHVSTDTCSQYVFSLRSTVLPTIRSVVKADCSDDASVIAAAIAPKIPVVTTTITTDSISLVNGKKVCKYIATLNEGAELPTCGKGYKQINTWTVIDWCKGMIVATKTQLVIVEDTKAPTTSAAGTVTFAADPFDCSGTVNVGDAKGKDDCSPDAALLWTTSISSTGGSGHAGGGDVATVLNTNGGSLANIPIGSTVTVTWIATDECGNQSAARTVVFTNTVDNRDPVAICNNALNVTLVSTNSGQKARVYGEDLDDTSKDNCGIASMEVSLDGTLYSDYVTLDCSHVGTVTVYLKVTDSAKNFNICWTTVNVEDKTVPLVKAPADLTITCLEEIPAVGSTTTVSKGCVAPEVKYQGQTGGELICGKSTIVRTWKVTPAANSSHTTPAPYNVTQSIFVTKAPADWNMVFPADILNLQCDQPNAIPAALELKDILTERSCDDWRLNVSDKKYFGQEATACFKLIRTYTLINWCTVGDAGKIAAVVDNRKVNQDSLGVVGGLDKNVQAYGKFSYTQVFKVSDNTRPVATIVTKDSCALVANCFGGIVKVTVSGTDNCSDVTIISTTITGGGVTTSDPTPKDGKMIFTGLADGTYTVISRMVDGCGNVTTVSSIEVVKGDCKKPTPVGVVTYTALMENDMVDVWVSDIERSSSDNCTTAANLKFGVELLEDVNGDGVFTIADASTTMPTAQSVTLTCDKLKVSMLALWVMDEAGNTQVALIPIGVSDNDNSCTSGAAAAIQGLITNENDFAIDEVMVKFESSSQSLTEQLFSGVFNYSVPMHTDLTITPEKDLGYMNGVTTADLVKLQRHILGISSLSSAYQMIAADVNSDERVNTKDMLHISRLILGLYDALPNSASWKFVSKDHQFTNPSSPWGFPQAVNYTELDSDVQADFVGIKIGDLTGNASPVKLLGDEQTFVGEMTIALDETVLTPGVATLVEFKAEDFTDFAGYQFTISLGDNVTLTEVAPGVLPNMSEDANFGLNRLTEGTITTTWSNANGITLEDGAVLFSLTIESTETVNLSDVISINSTHTVAEAYNNDLDVHTVGVQFNRAEGQAFQLFQNQPNPFNGETMIGFNMPKSGLATLKVMNIAGQVLTTKSAEFVRGYNQIALSKSELNASGVLYYQIETADHSATKKMIILE